MNNLCSGQSETNTKWLDAEQSVLGQCPPAGGDPGNTGARPQSIGTPPISWRERSS